MYKLYVVLLWMFAFVSLNAQLANEVLSVEMASSSVGWAALNFNRVYKTTDGGATWRLYSTSNPDFSYIWDFSFIDENNGVAVTYSKVLKTTNGGVSWITIANQTSYGLHLVDYIDADNIAAYAGWYVYRTTDGGQNWVTRNVAQVENVFYTDISFANPDLGIVVGYYDNWEWGDPPNGFIRRTTDGGQTWSEPSVEDLHFLDIHMINSNTGILVGGYNILRTTDGGANWYKVPDVPPGYYLSVSFSDALNGIAAGDGIVSTTSDGGVTWTKRSITFDRYNSFNEVSFFNNSAVAGGIYGLRKYSTDKGVTWNDVTVETGDPGPGPVPPANLAAYWKLDELSGNTYADFTGVNNGMGNLAPASVTGRVGRAQQFNGSSTRIDVPANPSLNFAGNDNFSVEFWYKGSTVSPSYKMIAGRHVNSSNRWYIGFKSNSRLVRFTMTVNGSTLNLYGNNIVDGNWHHVAVTRNGSTGATKIFTDGVLRSSVTQMFTGSISSSTAKMNIGNYAGNYVLNGIVDELAVHRAELTSAVVQDHYTKGLAGKGYYDSAPPTNSAPIITSTAITSGTVGGLYSYDVNATGTPAPVFSLLTSPAGMTINQTSGLIQWTPAGPGNFNVSVQASNGVSPAAVQSFTINVSGGGGGGTELPADLAAYWKLDELSGSSYADLTGVNNAMGNVSPASITGRVGQAQQFNGTTTRIDAPANPSLDFAAGDNFTVEFWYKGNVVPAEYKIITGRHVNSSNRWYIGFKSGNGSIRFVMTSAGVTFDLYGGNIINGNWHHVAVTRNGTTGLTRIYTNGVLSSSVTSLVTGNISSPTVKLNIGNYAGGYVVDGSIDEVAIHKSELSAAVVQDHYNKGLAGQPYYILGKPNTLTEVVPEQFYIAQNYPNPFNPSTTIRYQLPEESKVRISVYNITGELVAELADEVQQAGFYDKQWSADNNASGMYLLVINAQALKSSESYFKTVKMMLVK